MFIPEYTVCFAHELLDSGALNENSCCIQGVQCPSVQNGEYSTVSFLLEYLWQSSCASN